MALLAAQNAEARVWYVDLDGTADFTSIQAAIEAASPNDTVFVAAGTYEEALDYMSKDLVVMSTNGPESPSLTLAHLVELQSTLAVI